MKNVAEMYSGEVIVVQDNLNTHTYGSFYEKFDAEEARKLCRKFEFHYTPKKASWLNMQNRVLSFEQTVFGSQNRRYRGSQT